MEEMPVSKERLVFFLKKKVPFEKSVKNLWLGNKYSTRDLRVLIPRFYLDEQKLGSSAYFLRNFFLEKIVEIMKNSCRESFVSFHDFFLNFRENEHWLGV